MNRIEWTRTAAALLAVAVACLAADSLSPHTHDDVAILASDVYPGFGVKQFAGDDKYARFRLLDTGHSQYFAVLPDGLLMTTTGLGGLPCRRPVDLVVLEESPNATVTHGVRLFVLERRDMLRFSEDAYPDGKVLENLAAGARVRGVPVLHAFGEGVAGLPVRYAIVDGNDDGAFALKTAENVFAGNVTNKSYYKGVHLVTKRPLDRERKAAYDLIVRAADGSGIDKSYARVRVTVLDENDNRPVFARDEYRFVARRDADGTARNGTRYTSVGRVRATDADGDRVAYRLTEPAAAVVVVPQTGELLVSEDAFRGGGDRPRSEERRLTVDAHDLRDPSLSAERPARVWIRWDGGDAAVVQMLRADGDDELVPQDASAYDDAMRSMQAGGRPHRVYKRRVTRAVRPTKRIEFTETDGEQEGRSVFPLEKETEKETFKIRDENPWVTVEPNGAVRVKKKWDYEELGPEKTIDFWVTITNAGVGGK